MKLYFSGVASAKEAHILQSIGINDYLADPKDWHNVTAIDESIKHAAVDSGAYRAFKAGAPALGRAANASTGRAPCAWRLATAGRS